MTTALFLKTGFLGDLPQIHQGKAKMQIPGSCPISDESEESQWWERSVGGTQESNIQESIQMIKLSR